MNRFSSYIVGAGTLPIQCAEILLARGHKICGIITPDPALIRWASERDIPHTTPADDLVQFLSQQPFDCLFSIVNEHILPKEVFDLPRLYAINYHDAPLPRYAGTHATSWALMNRESAHGISWHLITDVVDAGDILKQRLIEIAPRETAFSLNTKCYEAAIHSFAELVDDLAAGRALAKKQNLEDRTFFARFKRPPAGCIISWNASASEIDVLVRALSFGPHPNPLGAARLAIEGEFVIVAQTSLPGESSQADPGTVTRIGPDFISVAAKDGDLRLEKLFTIDGKPLSVSDFVARFKIREGDKLADPCAELTGRVESFIASACKHEAFWVKRLATLQPAALPYFATAATPSQSPRYLQARMPIPGAVLSLLESQPESWSKTDFLIAAYTAYVARMAGTDDFDIGHRDLDARRDVAGFENLLSRRQPLRISADQLESFAGHYARVREEIQLLKKRGAYLRDVLFRYPALGRLAETDTESLFPVAVERVERLSDYEAIAGSQITLVIPEHDSECLWVYDSEALDEQSVRAIVLQFTMLLSAAAEDPERRISDLPLITEEERHRLLVEWNQTSFEYPDHQCIHELFEAQASLTPEAIAVVFGSQRLTYDELNRRANRLAHRLRELGVGPETLVA
ncbi:MAG TPA: formyltransferase family protein, partial [Blastocatellia bacterium]|nr:formyltransferase family protein [Blastocatellia bacterium]